MVSAKKGRGALVYLEMDALKHIWSFYDCNWSFASYNLLKKVMTASLQNVSADTSDF